MKNVNRANWSVIVLLLGWLGGPGIGNCRSQSTGSDEPLAKVGGVALREAWVERYLAKTVPDWPVEPALQGPLRKAAVEHLISRQLILGWLEQNGFAPTAAQIEWRTDQLRAELGRVGRTLDEHLQAENLTSSEFQNEVRWELAWRGYLERELTDARLAARFQDSPTDFDGTELRVAQILFEVDDPASSLVREREASQVREQLQRGELSWGEAVQRYSQAPSRARDGDLGWIRRHEPMPEEFSRAAFELREGDIAPPVVSRFGIHLIKCLEIKPGKRQLGDVREEVRRTLMTEEFRRIAELARPTVEVWVRPDDERPQASNGTGGIK